MRRGMCERSPLGLPHTQNRMSGRPQVAEILLMRSPQTPKIWLSPQLVGCVCVCVVITAGPSTKLFTWGGIWEDTCYDRRQAEACVD
jgi:hypothetical protein